VRLKKDPEFQASLGYVVKPYFNNKKEERKSTHSSVFVSRRIRRIAVPVWKTFITKKGWRSGLRCRS
jgi:hypothetical protein